MKKLTILLLFYVFQQAPNPVESANILFFVGMSSYSHRLPMWPLAEALAEKGHNVTFVCPYLQKSPNPKIFDYAPKGLVEWSKTFDVDFDIFADRRDGRWLSNGWFGCPDIGVKMCKYTLEDEEYVNFVKSTKFDLVFIDALFNDCAYGMAHYWGAKTIVFHTSSAYSWFIDSYGLPSETSWLPMKELVFSPDMTFPERIANTLIPVVWDYLRKWYYLPKIEKLTKEKLGIQNLPTIEEMEWNTSMIFINAHYGEDFPRSLPPNTINVGGIAWREEDIKKSLAKDLEQFLDKGKEGFIYVSFGTMANFTKLDESVQNAFVGALRSFPNLQFVWKYEDLKLAEKFPDKNVYVDKWMPQQKLLSHPKIKGFITHSGLLGIQEAVRMAVPLISFPIFADQDYNAERVHRKEYGIQLEILSVTQTEIENAIKNLIHDPKYRKNMKTISTLWNDRPEEPLKTALWWTEYVLRHSHEELTALRPLGFNQPWWKKRGVDVWATVLAVVFVSFWIFFSLSCKIVQKVFCPSSNNCSSSTAGVTNGKSKVNKQKNKKKFL